MTMYLGTILTVSVGFFCFGSALAGAVAKQSATAQMPTAPLSRLVVDDIEVSISDGPYFVSRRHWSRRGVDRFSTRVSGALVC